MADSIEASNAVPPLEISNAITASDHGQLVVLFAWLSFTAGVLISAVRVQIRWPSNSTAGKDDLACAISTGVAFVQTAIVLNTVRNGFGRIASDLDDVQATKIAKVSGKPHLNRENRNSSNSANDASKPLAHLFDRISMQRICCSLSRFGRASSLSRSSSTAWQRTRASRASDQCSLPWFLSSASSPSSV